MQDFDVKISQLFFESSFNSYICFKGRNGENGKDGAKGDKGDLGLQGLRGDQVQ